MSGPLPSGPGRSTVLASGASTDSQSAAAPEAEVLSASSSPPSRSTSHDDGDHDDHRGGEDHRSAARRVCLRVFRWLGHPRSRVAVDVPAQRGSLTGCKHGVVPNRDQPSPLTEPAPRSGPPTRVRLIGQRPHRVVTRAPWLWPLLKRPMASYFDDRAVGLGRAGPARRVPSHLAPLAVGRDEDRSQAPSGRSISAPEPASRRCFWPGSSPRPRSVASTSPSG